MTTATIDKTTTTTAAPDLSPKGTVTTAIENGRYARSSAQQFDIIKPYLGIDKHREVLTHSYSDGKRIVATNTHHLYIATLESFKLPDMQVGSYSPGGAFMGDQGQFPQFDRVIPDARDGCAIYLGKEFCEQVSRVAKIVGKLSNKYDSGRIRLTFTTGSAPNYSGKVSGMIEAAGLLIGFGPVDYDARGDHTSFGEEGQFEVAVNIAYLRDAVNVFPLGCILRVTAATRPIRFDMGDDAEIVVVMPMALR